MFISLAQVLSELNHISINYKGGLLLQYLTSASTLMDILLICDVQKKKQLLNTLSYAIFKSGLSPFPRKHLEI